MQGESYRIWVRRWAEVLEENRQRLHFYRERLSYVEPHEEAELDKVVSKYLPPPSNRPRSSSQSASSCSAPPRHVIVRAEDAR